MTDRRLAVCTLGGGRDAADIAQVFLSAMHALRHSGWSGVLITGPYMAANDVERLSRHEAAGSVALLRMVEDVPSYLAASDAVVCMGGYNTVCELLALAVPAVVVPRVQPRQEQRMRAERLGGRGLLRWLEPDQLSWRSLAEGIESVSAEPRAALASRMSGIQHRGVQVSARCLAALLPAGRSAGIPGDELVGQAIRSGANGASG